MSAQEKIIGEIKRLLAFRVEEMDQLETLAFSSDDYCVTELGARVGAIKSSSMIRTEAILCLLGILEDIQCESDNEQEVITTVIGRVKGEME